MESLTLARDLLVILFTAFVGGVIAKKMRLPLVVGYLLGGIIVASSLINFINFGDTLKNIAEIGVALLLFTLGLDFNLHKIKDLGNVIIFGSLIQILLTIFLGVFIFPLFGMDFYSSFFLAAVFSLSSTAVVVKGLSEKGELDTLHGEIAAGWLFMQDLYTLPMMIILPGVGQMVSHGDALAGALVYFLKSIVLAFASFFLVIFIGKKIVPYIFEKIAELRSRELLLIASISFCLLFSFVFNALGFSFAIGAFIAGVLIASSSVSHGIFAEVRPLRDIFSVVFFVSLGLLMNPAFLMSSFLNILILVLVVIILKFLIAGLLTLLLGYHTKTATLVGISLVSVGEFAFILALTGVSSHLISNDTYMTILSVSFISLIISAPLLSKSSNIYYNFKKIISNNVPALSEIITKFDRGFKLNSNDLSNHVVVLGYGRVGRYICRALSMANIPYVVVDYNLHIIKGLKQLGVNVIYGDPSEIDVLSFAKVSEAKIIIMAYSDRHMQKSVVANIFTLNPKAKILSRIHFEEDQKILRGLGVSVLIQPEFEAALSITNKLFKLYNVPAEDVEGKITRLKIEHGLG